MKEDLVDGWRDPTTRRLLDDGSYMDLHPVSELPHPIIEKALESFGADPSQDSFVGPIESAKSLWLLEIRQAQWRGGVWQDNETGVNWLVVAGLAKGGHIDHDDFYSRIGRSNKSGRLDAWLPTDEDLRLLKQETAARILPEWELEVQASVRDALTVVQSGGSVEIDIRHPLASQGNLTNMRIVVDEIRDADYQADEIELEFFPTPKFAGSDLFWQLQIRVLISISPPEQSWQRLGNTFANIGEVGSWQRRVKELDELVQSDALAESEPGSTSHYSHREILTERTVFGKAVRAMCGAFFVPTQDHEKLPKCPTCQQRFSELPE